MRDSSKGILKLLTHRGGCGSSTASFGPMRGLRCPEGTAAEALHGILGACSQADNTLNPTDFPDPQGLHRPLKRWLAWDAAGSKRGKPLAEQEASFGYCAYQKEIVRMC